MKVKLVIQDLKSIFESTRNAQHELNKLKRSENEITLKINVDNHENDLQSGKMNINQDLLIRKGK
jgi:hypothetical protein